MTTKEKPKLAQACTQWENEMQKHVHICRLHSLHSFRSNLWITNKWSSTTLGSPKVCATRTDYTKLFCCFNLVMNTVTNQNHWTNCWETGPLLNRHYQLCCQHGLGRDHNKCMCVLVSKTYQLLSQRGFHSRSWEQREMTRLWIPAMRSSRDCVK